MDPESMKDSSDMEKNATNETDDAGAKEDGDSSSSFSSASAGGLRVLFLSSDTGGM